MIYEELRLSDGADNHVLLCSSPLFVNGGDEGICVRSVMYELYCTVQYSGSVPYVHRTVQYYFHGAAREEVTNPLPFFPLMRACAH